MRNPLIFMTHTDGSRIVYLAKAFLLTLVGSTAMALAAVLLLPASQPGDSPPPPFFGFVVLWPGASTILVWGVLAGAKRLTPTYWHAAGVSALAFTGLFTAASGLQGGLIFAWPYFIYSLTFLAWQLKSDLDGFAMTFLLQAAVNLVPALLLFGPAE